MGVDQASFSSLCSSKHERGFISTLIEKDIFYETVMSKTLRIASHLLMLQVSMKIPAH